MLAFKPSDAMKDISKMEHNSNETIIAIEVFQEDPKVAN